MSDPISQIADRDDLVVIAAKRVAQAVLPLAEVPSS